MSRDQPAKRRTSDRPAADKAFRTLDASKVDLLRVVSDWLWEQDEELRFVRVEARAYDIARISAERLLGKRRWELPIEGIDASAMLAHQHACERHESFRDFEYQVRGEDGVARWISVSGVPLFRADGSFAGYLGCGRVTTQVHDLRRELRYAERRLADFSELARGWFWEQDAEYRFRHFWGLTSEKMTISAKEALGKRRWELGLTGTNPEQMAAHRATLEAHRPFRDFRYHHQNAGGEDEIYSISGRPVFADDGEFLGYRGTGYNATHETGLEQAFRRQSQVLLAMHETLQGLLDRRDVHTVLQAIVRHAMTLADTDSGYIYLVDHERNCLELRVALGAVARYAGARLAPGEGLSGIVWQTGEPLVINDYLRWSWRSAQYADSGIVAIAGVPLVAGGRVGGVIGVLHVEPGRRFHASTITNLQAFAPLAALALDNAMSFGEMQSRLDGPLPP